jgi:hypothetical protein
MTPPNLNDLMAGFLARQQADRGMGVEPTATGEVEAFEAVPAQAVDPRLAWDAANEVLAYLVPSASAVAKMPAGWSQLVASLDSLCALPMAVGHFPQAVRDLLPLVRAEQLSNLVETKKVAAEAFNGWSGNSKSNEPQHWLLQVAMLRLTGQLDAAEKLLGEKRIAASPEWQAAIANEIGALAWSRGDKTTAVATWTTLPAGVVRSFNLGVAALFSDQAADAKTHLQTAVGQLNEASPWHHLARLYLALADNQL